MGFVRAVVLTLCVVSAVSAAPGGSEALPVLTQKTLSRLLAGGQSVVVGFVVSAEAMAKVDASKVAAANDLWTNTAALLEGASTALKEFDMGVRFALMDLSADYATGHDAGAKSAGTIVMFRGSLKVSVVFPGYSAPELLARWILATRSPAVRLVTHKNVKRDFDGIHDEAKVLGHFASEDDAAYRHFERAALRLQTHVVFYAIIDPTLAKLARKIKVGTARLSLPYGAGSHALDDPTAFFATIARLRKSQPLKYVTLDNLRDAYDSDEHNRLCMAVLSRSSTAGKNLLALLKSAGVAFAQQHKIPFVWIDSDVLKLEADKWKVLYGLEETQTKAVIGALSPAGTASHTWFNGPFSKKSLGAFFKEQLTSGNFQLTAAEPPTENTKQEL